MKLLLSNLLLLSFLFLITFSLHAQTPKTFKEKNDPEATKVLKNLKKVYEGFDGLLIKYSLEVEYGEKKEVQEGEILQVGNKYRINNNGNLIINDEKTVWVYTKKQNEVQVNDYDAKEDFQFTPAQILSIDENNKDFVYAITDEDPGKGYKIEFKPLDKESDIMKIRIEVDKAQTKITSVKVFQEDGTRLTFNIKSISNTKPSADSFKFAKDKFPGVKEVDLRD